MVCTSAGETPKTQTTHLFKTMSFRIVRRFRDPRPTIHLNDIDNEWMGIDILNASSNPYPHGVKVYAHDGSDNVIGSKNGDALFGMNGRDRLWGGKGSDYMHGGADSDLCDGGRGNDVIDGGAGVDKYIGGSGRDTFVIREYSGNLDSRWEDINVDTIIDFKDVGDKVKLGSAIGDFNVTVGRGNCFSTDGEFCLKPRWIPNQRYIRITGSDGVDVGHALLPSDHLFDIAIDRDQRTVQIVGSQRGQGLDPIHSNLQYI